MVRPVLSHKHRWLVVCLSLLAGCSSSNVYLNTENDPFACNNKPPIEQEQCMERSMTAGEYRQEREKILAEDETEK